MTDLLLDTTWRSETLVNRVEELQRIRQAIYDAGRACKVVVVTGAGGVGKTRLVQEILWCAGNADERRASAHSAVGQQRDRQDWTTLGKVVVSNLIDLVDTQLSTRTQLLRAIREALRGAPGVDFTEYDSAAFEQQRAVERGAAVGAVSTMASLTQATFVREFKRIAEQTRVVLVFDTAESLRWMPASAEDSPDIRVLTPEDQLMSSRQWLIDQLQQATFENTTLIIAGRSAEEEGGPFFTAIEKAAPAGSMVRVALQAFSFADTCQYFAYIANDWRQRTADATARRGLVELQRNMEWLAGDEQALRVVHLYTGGKPVLLSLYAAILLESSSVPKPLTLTVDEAEQRIASDGIDALQSEIEHKFNAMLFAQSSLRSRVMQILVRAKRGLTVDQLCYALDEFPPDQPISERRRREVSHLLDAQGLRYLSIVKVRQDGRVGLQDEIYRIYAQRMAEEPTNCEDEAKARHILYEKLRTWATYQQARLEKQRHEFQEDDERHLYIVSPARSVNAEFPVISHAEEEVRNAIRGEIQMYERERMYYSLLIDPATGLNDVYFDMVERRWQEYDIDSDLAAQAEMWRALNDDQATRFVHTGPARIQAMRAAARHDNAVRWLVRFIMRGQYSRAMQYYDAVEAAIQDLTDYDERRRWSHTFARSERAIWRYYAEIMLGNNVAQAVSLLLPYIEELVLLSHHTTKQPVFPERWGGECGFIGHEALTHMKRVIAIGYNSAGYGYAVIGNFKQAVENYGRALRFLRETGTRGQQAATRNNLGRALSELGRSERGRRVCVDALALRREQGAEISIAMSINTIALIDNQMRRPDLAWREAAKAVAYLRRADMRRSLGLALLQLSTALRRLAQTDPVVHITEDPPDRVYAEAERAAYEAVTIFTDASSAKEELPRRIEAWIEYACTKRDQAAYWLTTPYPTRARSYVREAVEYLQKAMEEADAHGLRRHALDAAVNLAWTYFYGQDTENAESAIEQAIARVPAEYRLHPKTQPSQAQVNESYVLYQLSKLCGLQGRMSIDRFNARVAAITSSVDDRRERHRKIQKDALAQQHLRAAADVYVQALCYAALYSPRSVSLQISYDHIYNALKKFNVQELEGFRRYQRQARKLYRVHQAPIEDYSNLDVWLDECFGEDR